jgi:hypothetical protein
MTKRLDGRPAPVDVEPTNDTPRLRGQHLHDLAAVDPVRRDEDRVSRLCAFGVGDEPYPPDRVFHHGLARHEAEPPLDQPVPTQAADVTFEALGEALLLEFT